MRKPIIFGNWKMNKTNASALTFIEEIEKYITDKADFGIAVPYTILDTAVKTSDKLKIASQNVHFEERGAFTGEISVEMLKELNIDWVILGHSERRMYFNEINPVINKKIKTVIKHEISPIVCIGETLMDFENGKTEEVIKNQLTGCLSDIDSKDIANLVIAYEPVWAIGTGKFATVEIAQNACFMIRKEIENLFGKNTADKIRIQYGGSVNPSNIKEYMSQKDIDGALIGGASLEVESFKEIIKIGGEK